MTTTSCAAWRSFGVLRETQDSIQEFRVVTSNANADEGRSSGAQVSMVTKSGTNKYHGAAYEYFRPTNTVANDYFNKQGQLASGQANRPPKLVRNIFGGDVGGFLLKDKLFFFGNYEGQRLAENQVVVQTTPTAAYQAGSLQYTSGGATVTLTPAQVAQLDAGCQVCGTPQYTPDRARTRMRWRTSTPSPQPMGPTLATALIPARIRSLRRHHRR